MEALANGLKGLASYPTTAGHSRPPPGHRRLECQRRYGLALNPETEILPVNGSREALFSFAQTVIDPSRGYVPLVVSPNPFYQIYEGAAYLSGAEPRFLNNLPDNDFAFDYATLSRRRMGPRPVVLRLLTGQPDRQGAVAGLTGRRCSRCPTNTVSSSLPTSAIRKSSSTKPTRQSVACRPPNCLAARNERLVMFSSLSKRSNVPGMRSGFVAGDAEILKKFLLYRTYHGCALAPPVQAASIAAWNDEAHVLDNRHQYREKVCRRARR
jgi:N-succinyldiaminopimelate aminotransferase